MVNQNRRAIGKRASGKLTRAERHAEELVRLIAEKEDEIRRLRMSIGTLKLEQCIIGVLPKIDEL